MGLDQWIFKKTPNFDYNSNEMRNDEIVIYWRKCNQIHGYFDRLKGGIDDVSEDDITLDDIIDLRDTCQKVLDNHNLASELLPVTTGFFFGSDEYDEFYFQDLEQTVKTLNNFLEEDHTGEEFYYHAWW